ncbi:MAG: hypothetical protein Fur0018_01480 [Anaerolineales bacterium]
MRKFALFTLFLLTACAPHLIAAQPREKAIATYPAPVYPQSTCAVTLELAVADVPASEAALAKIAARYDGYVQDVSTWYENGQRHSAVTLDVPAYAFQAARTDVRSLGSLLNEWGGASPCRTNSGYAQITAYLHPHTDETPPSRPLRTLQSAWRVTRTLFGYLLDALIWLTVVGGPIALLAWGAYTLYRKIRPRG